MNQEPHNNEKKSAKTLQRIKSRISIRRHLPLAVRVHYDVVRNWTRPKMWGIGAMMLIAVFGVLLATQAVSPASSANTGSTGTGIEVRQSNAKLYTVKKISTSSIRKQESIILPSTQTRCDSSQSWRFTTSNWLYKKGSSRVLNNTVYKDRIVCFRAEMQQSSPHGKYWVRVYAKRKIVAFNFPIIVVEQKGTKNDQLSGRSTDANSLYGWQNTIVSSKWSCRSSAFKVISAFETTYQHGRTRKLNNDDNRNKYACFRAYRTGEYSQWGYGHLKIGALVNSAPTVKPTISATQDGKTMTATAGTHNNQSAIGWQKTITASSCNENAFKHRGVTTGSRFTNLTTGSAVKRLASEPTTALLMAETTSGATGQKPSSLRVPLQLRLLNQRLALPRTVRP